MTRHLTHTSPEAELRLGKTVMVPLWSSGFVVGALLTEHAHALPATMWRFAVAAPLMAAIALAGRARWPRSRSELVHVTVVGVLLQAVQFSGIYTSLQLGVPAGLAALLAGSPTESHRHGGAGLVPAARNAAGRRLAANAAGVPVPIDKRHPSR